jgi:hypothetical protein
VKGRQLTSGEIWCFQWEYSANTAVFWDLVPCSLIDIDRGFKWANCLHHQGDEHPTRHPSSINKCLHRNVSMITYVNWIIDSMMECFGFLVVRMRNKLRSCFSPGGACESHTHKLLVPLHLTIPLITGVGFIRRDTCEKYRKYLPDRARTRLQTLSANRVGKQFANTFRPSFVRVWKQSANKYKMFLGEIWCSHGGEYEDGCLLSCCTV